MSETTAQRVAMVTGAGRGIGASIATRLAADGLAVAVCDIDEKSALATATELQRTGAVSRAFGIDVADAESVQAVVDLVQSELGPIDVLVNNAGVISVASIVDLAEDEWDRVLDINLKNQFLCSRSVLPGMRDRGWGRIVNIASDAAKTAEAFIAHYSASKFGVVGLTQSIALEFALDGITANAICPAITRTPMMDQLAEQLGASVPDGTTVGEWSTSFIDEIPLGRAMRPEDIAHLCSFLVSEGAGAISGQAMNVSGAHEMH